MNRSMLVLGTMIASAHAAAGVTYTETFDDGQNHSGWSWDRTALGSIQPAGGNAGGYFESALMAAPSLFTSHATFTGNFQERRVGSIGADLSTVQYATADGFISVALLHHNGTPNNPFDDTAASFITAIEAPVDPTYGWVSFDVAVPFDALTTPDGWRLSGLLPGLPATVDWQTLITNVDEVVISWSDPLLPTLLFDTFRGADNLRITYDVPAPATAALLGVGVLAATRRRR